MPLSVSRPLALLLLAGMAGCATKAPCPPQGTAGQPAKPDWHEAITDPDHVRLRAWRNAFVDGLKEARDHGYGPQIDAEGSLLDPDMAMDGAMPPVGAYRCRTLKIGAKHHAAQAQEGVTQDPTKPIGHQDLIIDPVRHCEIAQIGPLRRLVQTDGIQRPWGRIYPDINARAIFLGTMVLSDEVKPIRYGRDADRDLVGSIQRIGDQRWRMLLPDPAWESVINVVELVPVS